MLISTEQAAEILGVTRRRVQAMLKSPHYQYVFKAKQIGRGWVLDKSAVERVAASPRPSGKHPIA